MPLIEPYRLNIDAGLCRDLSNPHCRSLLRATY
jgi:hypothetical protein